MIIPEFDEIVPPNDQISARQAHLRQLEGLIGNIYPSRFDRTRVSGSEDSITNLVRSEAVVSTSAEIAARLSVLTAPEEKRSAIADVKESLNERLKELGTVRIAGRLTTPPRGNFVHLTDGIEKLQIYCKKGAFSIIGTDADGWSVWQLIDHGDFVGVEGYLFLTNTGEISVHVEKLQFLAKALVPMPDKMHGIEDPEIKQRQRYVDLIGSSLAVEHEGMTTREVFETRAKVISSMRNLLENHGYIEVETPMLTPKATGAAAKPFKTHHNALDIDLYARIAPELYLKRLLVGGFEKVYELNRNFRNEGISYKHNPEFTMLEFYCAYMDSRGMMDFCEELMRQAVSAATGSTILKYEENVIDFSKFERLPMRAAVERYAADVPDDELVDAFDQLVEPNLIQPTFITDFPKSISPLSKASPENPQTAERFELFINGMEIANGFSELNDPREQYARFVEQMSERERGDEEAMVLDEDYIRALSYAMPPAAGIGIGIDRLVMLVTNKHSIRDVILFPHLRPERRDSDAENDES